MTIATALALIAVALASYRLTRVVTADTLTNPVRAWLWAKAFVEDGYDPHRDKPVVRRRSFWWAQAYELARCPYCAGVYLSALTWWAWFYWPWTIIRPLIQMTAVMGLQALLSSRRDA